MVDIDEIARLANEMKSFEKSASSKKELATKMTAAAKDDDEKAEKYREQIERIMMEANEYDGTSRVTVAGGRFEIASKPASVIVTDRAAIPDEWWKVERKLDKTKINKAVNAGDEIPGTMLSNGGKILKVSFDD